MCWAFRSADWLAECVAGSFADAAALDRGLERYRKRHQREPGGHELLISNFRDWPPLQCDRTADVLGGGEKFRLRRPSARLRRPLHGSETVRLAGGARA
jgi:hypothetical protein